MKLNSQFNTLASLSTILLLFNYLFADKNNTSTSIFVCSAILIIGYAIHQNKTFFKSIEAMIGKVQESGKSLGNFSQDAMMFVDKVTQTSKAEEDRVEDTTKALENISSMVLRNKENTRQAAQLTQDVIKAVENGNAEMQVMMQSINEIKSLSDEIRKIMKVIDDIAFQTNMLALNAAVEAARAGDAGKGFAVVADEVKNLAQKSAEAAKSSSNIIEKNIVSAENGVNISMRVEEALVKMSEEVGKVEELINEITASSEEQATEVVRTKEVAKELGMIVAGATEAKESSVKSVRILDEKIADFSAGLNSFEKIEVSKEIVKEEKTVKHAEKNQSKKIETKTSNKNTIKKDADKKVLTKSPASKLTDKEFSALSKASEEKKVLEEKEDDLFEDTNVENSNQETTNNVDTVDDTDDFFNTAAFEKAKKASSVRPSSGISKSEAEIILPLDDMDGF